MGDAGFHSQPMAMNAPLAKLDDRTTAVPTLYLFEFACTSGVPVQSVSCLRQVALGIVLMGVVSTRRANASLRAKSMLKKAAIWPTDLSPMLSVNVRTTSGQCSWS